MLSLAQKTCMAVIVVMPPNILIYRLTMMIMISERMNTMILIRYALSTIIKIVNIFKRKFIHSPMIYSNIYKYECFTLKS